MAKKQHYGRSNESGFTLIELLVASTIVIILTAIGLVSFASSGRSARNSKRKADLETVRQALVLYRSDNGSYITSDSYSSVVGALVTSGYLSAPSPVDPKNGQAGFGYTYSGNSSSFCLCANTEGDAQGNSSTATCGFDGGTYHCVTNP